MKSKKSVMRRFTASLSPLLSNYNIVTRNRAEIQRSGDKIAKRKTFKQERLDRIPF